MSAKMKRLVSLSCASLVALLPLEAVPCSLADAFVPVPAPGSTGVPTNAVIRFTSWFQMPDEVQVLQLREDGTAEPQPVSLAPSPFTTLDGSMGGNSVAVQMVTPLLANTAYRVTMRRAGQPYEVTSFRTGDAADLVPPILPKVTSHVVPYAPPTEGAEATCLAGFGGLRIQFEEGQGLGSEVRMNGRLVAAGNASGATVYYPCPAEPAVQTFTVRAVDAAGHLSADIPHLFEQRCETEEEARERLDACSTGAAPPMAAALLALVAALGRSRRLSR